MTEIRDDDTAQAAPPRTPTESLHQAWPWREFGDQKGGGDIHSGFDHLRGNDDAVRSRAASFAVKELSAPGSAFGGAEPAVRQANLRACAQN